ncbi:STAS domain-containing protein [Nitrincola iocasae]|uniref:STAS domain-containing protein n=1 Tax=Nitrincola iocasae TaxID=2614693 RepID=A0A5J6LK87_9GAMM|nr:STAS domain-containing protein [Nitrincola iocasae]QEW08411.1 STAS domain-containing protein [Nitrincola iocasae]
MDIQIQLDEQGRCLAFLSGEFSIYHAADMKAKLLEALNLCTEMELNLADVSEIDTAGLQLLVMVEQEALRTDKRLHLTEHSAAVVDIMQLYDLTGYFGDPVLIKSKTS